MQAARDGAASRGAGPDVPPLMIPKELLRRLDALARRMGLPTAALGTLLLEAAVNEEERRFARERRAAQELEAVLVRAILRGDYDPAAGTHKVSGRSGPPPDGERR